MITKRTIIFLILIIFLFSALGIAQYFQNKETKIILTSTIQKGLDFYTPNQIKHLRIDSYFMLKEINKHLHHGFIPVSENIYPNDPFVKFLNKNTFLPNLAFKISSDVYGNSNSSYEINSQYQNTLVDTWDPVLLKALYCDIYTYTNEDFSILEKMYHQNGDYYDTHFLLGLLFLKENNCYQKNEQQNKIQAMINKVSGDIATVENNDAIFTDLYSERVVLLYWAGFGKNVKKEWIEKIENNLSTDPGWRADDTHLYSNPHTTGLSMLALIYYLENKQAQTPF